MQIKTSPGHRKCKYGSCGNILSIYNHEEYCNVHLKAVFWEDKVGGSPVKSAEKNIAKTGARAHSR